MVATTTPSLTVPRLSPSDGLVPMTTCQVTLWPYHSGSPRWTSQAMPMPGSAPLLTPSFLFGAPVLLLYHNPTLFHGQIQSSPRTSCDPNWPPPVWPVLGFNSTYKWWKYEWHTWGIIQQKYRPGLVQQILWEQRAEDLYRGCLLFTPAFGHYVEMCSQIWLLKEW